MTKAIKQFINNFEIDLKDKGKNEEFHDSLVRLVSILFAVVFGVGLSQLSGIKYWSYDFFVLVIAYLAVILSWWGYHWGIIVGPKETNVLNYLIDCFLLIVYWHLLYRRSPLTTVLKWYMVMLLLYLLWELIRICKEGRVTEEKKIIRKAAKANLFFLILVSLLLVVYSYSWQILCNTYIYWLVIKGYYILAVAILIIIYRIIIHRVYWPKVKPVTIHLKSTEISEKFLIERARDAATKARTHLSGFAVGAAILSDTGKIYVGCNIEFDNYSNTIHAEEAAISAFIAAGERKPITIAVFTSGQFLSFPCGMCRQSLFELGGNDLQVIACNNLTCESKKMKDLLPLGFHL